MDDWMGKYVNTAWPKIWMGLADAHREKHRFFAEGK